MMKHEHTLEQVQDLIHELGNIGIGSAGTSLSMLLDTQIKTTTLKAEPIDSEMYLDVTKMKEQVVGILFPYDKDIQGFALFLLEKDFVEDLMNILLKKQCDFKDMDKECSSMLQEVTGIMISSYLSGISQATNAHVRVQLPAVTLDMRGSIINDALSFLLLQDKKALWLDHEFQLDSCPAVNHLLFMLSKESIENIFQAVEVRR